MGDATLEGAVDLRFEYTEAGKLRRQPFFSIKGCEVEAFVPRESLVCDDLMQINGLSLNDLTMSSANLSGQEEMLFLAFSLPRLKPQTLLVQPEAPLYEVVNYW